MPEFEPILGRYFTLNVAGDDCRIYVEEAGRGIPLVCLHTAGADARQYRHLMCDPAITGHYRVIAFDLPIALRTIDWRLLLNSTALGIASLAGLGLVMGAWTMMMARHFWSVGDAVAAAMYLFSGAIFPLEVLPPWLRWIGYLFPATYWLEAARRALLGDEVEGFTTFAALSDAQLLLILAAFSVVLLVFSVYFYRWALHNAKDKGLLDLESSY